VIERPARPYSYLAPTRAEAFGPRRALWLGWLPVLILLAFAPAAYADDAEWVAMPPEQAARLKALADEYPLLVQENALLKQETAALKKLTELQDRLLALKDEEIAAHKRLAGLETQRADYWAGRVADAEKAACSEVRKARVTGYAATGAALGSAAFPGIGTVAGLAIGAAAGLLQPCP